MSEALAVRVVQAAERLQYVANPAGRALAGRQSKLAGLIMGPLSPGLEWRVVTAVQRVFDAAGVGLLVTAADEDTANEAKQARDMIAHGAAGVILVEGACTQETRRLLERHQIPSVACGRHKTGWTSVAFDYATGGAMTARYLIDIGHRRLALVRGPGEDERTDALAGGIETTLRIAEIPFRSVTLAPQGGERLAEDFHALLRGSASPTVLLCTESTIAVDAARAVRDRNSADSVAVVVALLDDLERSPAAASSVALSLRTPVAELGRRAAQHLTAALTGQAPQKPELVPVKLIVRGALGFSVERGTPAG